MQGYNYGDKVKVNYGYGYDNNYRNNQYQKIYNKNTGYNGANKWNKRTGWGFDGGNIAPKFDPNSHFESPYYDYDNMGWSHQNYWNRMRKGPWSNDDDRQRSSAAGSNDGEEKKPEKKDSKDEKEESKDGDKKDQKDTDEKKDGDKKEGDSDDKKEGDSGDNKDSKDGDKKEGKEGGDGVPELDAAAAGGTGIPELDAAGVQTNEDTGKKQEKKMKKLA